MDKIIINDLEVYSFHGVHDEEKRLGQIFIISVEISIDLETAALNDDLTKTVHYGEVCKDIELVMNSSKYNLIEAAAYNIIKTLLANYPSVLSIKIILKKPWAPIGKHLKYAAVEIERSREQMDS